MDWIYLFPIMLQLDWSIIIGSGTLSYFLISVNPTKVFISLSISMCDWTFCLFACFVIAIHHWTFCPFTCFAMDPPREPLLLLQGQPTSHFHHRPQHTTQRCFLSILECSLGIWALPRSSGHYSLLGWDHKWTENILKIWWGYRLFPPCFRRLNKVNKYEGYC